MQALHRDSALVAYPVQGAARFSSPVSELILSDVYWMWIIDSIEEDGRRIGRSYPLVDVVRNGFPDPKFLIEMVPVDESLLDAVRGVAGFRAPSFERLVPACGDVVPTPEVLLNWFARVVSESLAEGAMEMEVE